MYIELTGSPQQLIYQKKGVEYAVNCAGPAYKALTDITYISEFSRYANFDPNNFQGR